MKLELLLSLVLHVCFIWLFSHQTDVKLNSSSGKGGEPIASVLPKPATIVSLIEIPERKKPGLKPIKKTIPKPVNCKKYYTGIGIQTEVPTITGEKIWNVFKGYPADQNGLLIGDIILSKSENDITGPEGTPITLTIMRYGNIFKITIIRSKVCY